MAVIALSFLVVFDFMDVLLFSFSFLVGRKFVGRCELNSRSQMCRTKNSKNKLLGSSEFLIGPFGHDASHRKDTHGRFTILQVVDD